MTGSSGDGRRCFRRHSAILLLSAGASALSVGVGVVAPFAIPAPPRRGRVRDRPALAPPPRRRAPTALPASGDGSVPGSPESTLQFVGRTTFASDPLPLPPPGGSGGADALLEFFRDPRHRDHLLLGEGAGRRRRPPSGGAAPSADRGGYAREPSVKPLPSPATPDLWDRWSKEAARAGVTPPRPPEDKLLLVKSSGISFPLGMTIFVESIVGAKLLAGGPYPEYQFTLVKDTIRAEGPPALVWVHNTLTGAIRDEREQTTHSFSTLRVTPSGEGKVVFTSDSRIEINVRFPSVLLRLLPMSRERCNEQGSASIQKSFEERGAPSLHNFVRAYVKWLEPSCQP